MEILLIFTFCLIIAGTDAVTTVTGYRRQSVQIKCPYQPGYEKSKKYLCRGKCSGWFQNDIPVQSGSPAKDTRFSLYDDTAAKLFTVTITDLRKEDENSYWCVIERMGRDIFTEIQLLVKKGDPALSAVSHTTHTHSKNQTYTVSTTVHPETTLSTIVVADAITTVTGYRGRSVQMKCSYTSGYEKYKKYLCRGECPYVGYSNILVQSGSPAKDSRFSLHDDTTAKVFTVTITDLRPEDEGTYWCAIEWLGRDSYTKIQLLVKKDDPVPSSGSNTKHPQSKTQSQTGITLVHPETTLSTKGKADYIMISTGAMLFTFGVIIEFYC